MSIKVDDDLVQQGVNQLQNSLIGRLTLTSGEAPYSLDDLKAKLGQVWGISSHWRLIPIGKGYYNIQLPSLEDRDRILDKRAWALRLTQR